MLDQVNSLETLIEPMPDHPIQPGGQRKKQGAFLKILKWGGLALIALPVGFILCFRFVPPPISAFMVARYLDGVFDAERQTTLAYQWVNWEAISPQIMLAVVAAEDQKFPYHRGFDFTSIAEAIEEQRAGGRVRGASTITQQVAKNLFLWNGRSYLRKGLEAYLTLLIEFLWPKRRVLEVYVNIAEFGDGIYGVSAAAERFFRKQSSVLTRQESALLAAVLPNPQMFKVDSPSAYVRSRSQHIIRQMQNLGGTSYLKNL
ncbi:monofunctional biosynthetic peptidoglycan transglycosylase [Candidatus Vecturithrix granuli]|uniref:Biosynthetic peptidoglycan transglycosylase n=1 Tax=Vecturithrix granuli TaxID=1499967 RepID=A0A0S6WB21_VECG1|nr:monofunctional biosynthetic peptidoglycan transglycosylase [Candidatus Vecturithrix granuli]